MDGARLCAPPGRLKYQRKHGKDADRLALSDELLQLMPPAPADGWTVQMPSTPPATEWLRRWEYPPVRRAGGSRS